MSWNDKNTISLVDGALSSRIDKKRKLLSKARVEKVYFDYEPSNDGKYKIPPGVIETIDLNGSKVLRAYPLDESLTTLPIVGEVVEIVRISGKPFYRRLTILGESINSFLTINDSINIGDDSIDSNKEGGVDRYSLNVGAGSKSKPTTNIGDYKNSSVQTNAVTPKENILNSKFKGKAIQRLKFYEGDTVIQSRFGQSIRFSAYNNPSGEYNPTLIIKNGLSNVEENKLDESTEEDINYDSGTIAFTSGKYISNFIPGILDTNGVSNFQLKVWENSVKYALENYPRQLDGNQIIITSDRVILSSKVNEMMFFSKGVMSLVSDSYFTLDSNSGISIINQKNDIQFVANDQEVKFFVGKNGKIFLGIDENSPSYAAINGKDLVDLLGELIKEIVALTYGGVLTPSGPSTGVTPDKLEKFKSLAAKLPGLLSKRVFIGM